MSINNKLIIYKHVIRPTITYAAPIWAYSAHSNKTALIVQQNKCLRMISNVKNSQIQKDLKIPPLEDYIKDLSIKFFHKASHHPNPLIRRATDYDADEESKIKKPKLSII